MGLSQQALADKGREKDPYFFSMPEINLWGHILKREDMSLVFYETEDIKAIADIFNDFSNPELNAIHNSYINYYTDSSYNLYNFGPVLRDKTKSVPVAQLIANKWRCALEYFRNLKPEEYIQFVNYCSSFLRHELHSFFFFIPNYRINEFSNNKDVELYYHWRLAINR